MGFSEQEYQDFLFHLAEGVVVVHKTYGQGVVTAIDDSNITIWFDEIEKSFNLKILFQKKLLTLEG